MNDNHHQTQAWIRKQIWSLYADLKTYQVAPNEALKEAISTGFDQVCTTRTEFETLDQAL